MIRAIREDDARERLHMAVRALCGLVLAEKGRGRRTFSTRCKTFAAAKDDALAEIFDLRSLVEHLNDFAAFYSGVSDEVLAIRRK